MSVGMSAHSVKKKPSTHNSRPSTKMCIREQRGFITMSSPVVSWPVPMRAIGAQNLLTMPGGVSIAGYLHKKGGSQFSLMKWPLRYIIIHKGCMYYFKSSTSAAPQGAFSLNGYNRVMRAAEETTSNNVFPFKVVHFSKKHRTWFFSAASEDERRKWMRYLRREINYYNDKKEAHIPSDTDSDADSFYGTIERPMDIKHLTDTTEDDYGEDDDDEDEEDYLKPDDDCSPTSPVRPTAPPPSYPPPPVPAVFPVHQDSSAGFHKGPPPAFPSANRIPTISLPKNPPPSLPLPPLHKDLGKGPLPPLPLPSPVYKPPSPTPPPSIRPDQRRISQCRTTSVGRAMNDRDWRPQSTVLVQSPATLPICDQLETRMALNGPVHCSLNSGGSQSLGSKHCNPSITPPQNVHTGRSSPSYNQMCSNMDGRPPVSLQPKTGLLNKPETSVPFKPPLPTTKPKSGAPLQRASPDGQSIRLRGDEIPTEYRRKRDRGPHSRGEDSDDDYVNVQLPESVFIDSTETSFVEKLFKESAISPLDGLYGIRNSGTKTSKVLVVWDVSINRARNYRLFEEGDCIYLESDMTFPDLPALIEHYYSHPLPHHGSLCLQQPYTKTPSIHAPSKAAY